jgi:hypothetical protein
MANGFSPAGAALQLGSAGVQQNLSDTLDELRKRKKLQEAGNTLSPAGSSLLALGSGRLGIGLGGSY